MDGPGTTLFAALALRGWFPGWLAVLLGLSAVAAVATLYRREAGRLPVLTRAVLAAFRAAALAILLFLLLRPTLVTDAKGEKPRPVALLVDDSQSMLTKDARTNIADRWRVALAFGLVDPAKPIPPVPTSTDLPADVPDRPSRVDLAKQILSNKKLTLLDRFAAVGPLQPSAVGAKRAGKDPRDTKWVEALQGTEPRSALADTVYDLLKRDEIDLPSSIVLLTDGRENASTRGLDEVARECKRLNVPVHVIGVGASAFGQLQIRDAAVPETLFVDDTAPLPVRFRVKGAKGSKAEITVTLNGQEVAKKTVDAPAGDDRREVMSFVPQLKDVQPGKQDVTVTVRLITDGEVLTDTLTKSVRVVDRKVKVLVVDSSPRWDFKFLQRALLRDRRVVAEFFLTEGDARAMKSGPPFISAFPATRQELFAYDLLILGDVPASALSGDQRQMVREFVAEGGGFICIAGRNHGPASWAGTPLADVLPVEFQPVAYPIDSGDRPQGFRPELTGPGLRSTALALDDDPLENLKIWRELPEIFWAYPVTKLKPAADALLTHPRDRTTDNKPMPVLAAHYYGKGYAVWVGFDETWRWRFNAADKLFGRFWTQGVYVAGVPRTLGTKLTQLSLDTADPQLGKAGQVYARLFTPDMRPLTADRVEARLERLDAAADDKDRSVPVDLKALPGQAGEYVAVLPFNRVGRFALKVDNAGDPAQLEYRVGLPADHELAPGGLAEDDMRTFAAATGGTFFREEDLHLLKLTPQSAPFTRREERLLWNHWMLVLVVGLFTAEWFLRKFNSLS